MMTAVEGYYNGSQIVTDEKIRLRKGQRLIITVLENTTAHSEKPTDLRKYMGRGKKMFNGNVDTYVEELRANDRV